MLPHIGRRRFIGALGTGLAGFAASRPSILSHEHVLVDFAGADRTGPGRYDPDEVFRVALPKLREVQALGCRRIHECTPNFLGRDPALLARLSAASGVELWTNTGLYGASAHKFLPAYALTESAGQLARRWIAEARTSWRPRFIKIGVNNGPLNPVDRKLVEAAALTSRETGLTIASHTGNGIAALEQLEIVAAANVNLSKFVWVHAQNERDHSLHEKVALTGAWASFDGIGPKSASFHLECVRFMAAKKLLHRTLVSQDAGWYHVGEPGGGEYRGYTFIYSDFLPQLNAAEVSALMYDNPLAAFGK